MTRKNIPTEIMNNFKTINLLFSKNVYKGKKFHSEINNLIPKKYSEIHTNYLHETVYLKLALHFSTNAHQAPILTPQGYKISMDQLLTTISELKSCCLKQSYLSYIYLLTKVCITYLQSLGTELAVF